MTPDSIDFPETMNLALLEQSLSSASTYDELKQLIVDEPFKQPLPAAALFLGIMVLLVVNKKTGMLDRVTLSQTELATNTTVVSQVPFEDIKIPLDNPDNIILKAIQSGKPYDTTDWYYTFTPALTGQEARINQASGGIAYTAIHPLIGCGDGAALSFSYYQYKEQIGEAQQTFMEGYAALVAKLLSKKM